MKDETWDETCAVCNEPSRREFPIYDLLFHLCEVDAKRFTAQGEDGEGDDIIGWLLSEWEPNKETP